VNSQHQRTLSLAILCFGLAGPPIPALEESRLVRTGLPGIVVEEVGKGSALEKGGLLPGDLLLAWERAPDSPANPEGGRGEIRTVFDWLWIKAEQAPRGAVRLHGEREGVATSFDLPKGLEWDARVRPRMAADLLQIYMEVRRRVEAGDVEGGVALWDQLAQRAEPQAAPGLRSWVLLKASEAWTKGGQGARARSALQAALAAAQDPQTRVVLREALGESYQYSGELARAEASFHSSLEVGESVWGESLRVASTIARLGNVLRLLNRLDEAEKLQHRALEIRQRWAPDSLEVVDSLHQLFTVAMGREDEQTMSEFARRALDLQKRWPPDNLAMANTLGDLAVLKEDRAHYAEAAVSLQRAQAILERRAPESIPLANNLGRLGLDARLLGDDDSAVDFLQRALAIRDKLAPESLGTAAVLNNLGAIAREGGDLAAAAMLFQRALAISEKAAPNSFWVAGGLDSLGIVARLRGDLDEALEFHRRAQEIRARLPLASRLDVARNLSGLGSVAEARGDLKVALDFFQQAHELYERSSPNTLEEAQSLQQIGRTYRRMRHPDLAARFFARAVDALEAQVEGLGGTQDLQAAFRARHEEIYRDAIDLELERGHAAEAFHLLERSQARSFLTLLSERDLELTGELPAPLERSRRDNAARYDQTLHELSRWTPKAGEEAREALHRELSRLRRERDEIAAEIRKASPRLAALRQPQPLDLAAAQKVLDPGTLALSYSVGEKQTALFALTREGRLRVKVLPVGEKRLRQDTERFLEKVKQPTVDPEAVDLARALYRKLISPVADLVGKSQRVLILPDGPLHRLPFGALRRDPGGRRQFLAEWKPLHAALSLTVYGALRASRGEPTQTAATGTAQLAAFGDPRYPKDLAQSGESRDPLRRTLGVLRGFHWAPLPYSRREVERIAAAYPEARLYLGEEATEERAKDVAPKARILHFATHAYLDDRIPLDSALVLTIPEELAEGRDNGLLQVWEIFESVRLDADLVVLSACDSALGRELSGEGLIGLTRAFQYAGARSVVASLWSVSDQATAELMTRFHRHYAAGLSKDEALRQAQIELIRKPIQITIVNGQTVETDASAPFFWAAFQLFGDWR
jgi:CHAT domain-containing protein